MEEEGVWLEGREVSRWLGGSREVTGWLGVCLAPALGPWLGGWEGGEDERGREG